MTTNMARTIDTAGGNTPLSLPTLGDEQGRQIVNANFGQPAIWDLTVGVAAGGAYAAGDVIGAVAGAGLGLLSAPVFKVGHWLAYLNTIRVMDADNQKQELTVLFFDVQPGSSTITDNAAFAFGATEYVRVCGIARVLTGDYFTVNNRAYAYLGGLNMLLNGPLGAKVSLVGTLYAVVLVQGAATFGDGNLRLRLGLQLQSAPALGMGNFN
jgi:hypothetical protein